MDVGCAEPPDHFRLPALGDPVEHEGLMAALDGEQRGQQPDRAGSGDQHRLRCPGGAVADPFDVVPGLGHDGGGFQEHAEDAECGINRDQVFGMDPVALGRVSVTAGDAALGVLAIDTHVPLPCCACRAGHRVAASDDADDQIPGLEAAIRGCLGHPTQ